MDLKKVRFCDIILRAIERLVSCGDESDNNISLHKNVFFEPDKMFLINL